MFRQSPYESFSQRLAELQASTKREEWLGRQIADAAGRRPELVARVDAARARLADEIRDVERLEGDSLLAWFYRLLGRLDRKQEAERAEVGAAILVVEQAERELRALDREVGEMESRRAALAGVDAAYRLLREEAAAWVRTSGDLATWKLFEESEAGAALKELYRELTEARRAAALIDAGLTRVRAQISDVGDDVARFAATSPPDPEADAVARLRELMVAVGEAGNALAWFRKEVEDLRLHPRAAALAVTNRSLSLGFAAIFFAQLVGDWLARDMPERALDHIDRIHAEVRGAMQQLDALHRQLATRGG